MEIDNNNLKFATFIPANNLFDTQIVIVQFNESFEPFKNLKDFSLKDF